MSKDVLHEALRQALATMRGQDVDIRQVRECCLVGYDASEADLFGFLQNTKTE